MQKPQKTKAEASSSSNNDVITIVRDRDRSVGKSFAQKDDGSITKKSNVQLSRGIARQHHVPTQAKLKALIEEVAEDKNAAIINSGFSGIPMDEEFLILSGKVMAEHIGASESERNALLGVHEVELDGKTYKAVCRFRENMYPSSWQLIDRDADEHAPEPLLHLSGRDFDNALEKVVPGYSKVQKLIVSSSSSRVYRNGEPISQSNAHIFIKVNDPTVLDDARKTVIPRAIAHDLAWQKPRHSRTEPNKVIGSSFATIIDPSVWTTGRLIFCGKPTADASFTVEPTKITTKPGLQPTIDLTEMVLPDAELLKHKSRTLGKEVSLSTQGDRVLAATNDLTLDTVLETQYHGNKTVRELLERGEPSKVRCQTPFRESESFAAFLSVNDDGCPYLHDSGTGITHWLHESEEAKFTALRDDAVVQKALKETETDAAAVLEPPVIKVLARVKANNEAAYVRLRAEFKERNANVSLTSLDRTVRVSMRGDKAPRTHHEYAKATLDELTTGNYRPITYSLVLYTLDPGTNLWVRRTAEELQMMIPELFEGSNICCMVSHYKAIANHAAVLAIDDMFFKSAPAGIACPGGFYSIVDGKVDVTRLKPEHRQRVMLEVTPTDASTPKFDQFLHETFKSENKGEEEQQIGLLQEIFGAVLLGLSPRFQKAYFFYDPRGRAGKGTVERILRRLVPEEFVTAESPFDWDDDNHLANLAGARLNVVGELPDNKPIPAAKFKTLLGGDMTTGRFAYGRPLKFVNEAAHLFMSNHFIMTKDHSPAFYSRWVCLKFPNSRLAKGLPINPNLADEIVGEELPGIAGWALKGAQRLLENNGYSHSDVNHQMLDQWRVRGNTLQDFVHNRCRLNSNARVLRAEFYRAYTAYCSEIGRSAFSKAKVLEQLIAGVEWEITLHNPNGNKTLFGVEVLDEGFEPLGLR